MIYYCQKMKRVKQFFRHHRLSREWRICAIQMFYSSTITSVTMYKTQGARATDPGKDQGEANALFVDNKLSLFFAAVNGVSSIVQMWWDVLDRLRDVFGN